MIKEKVLKEIDNNWDNKTQIGYSELALQSAINLAIEFERERILKLIEETGIEDVISFLEGLKDFRVEGTLPLGTCDYMAIDDMIKKLKDLITAT